MRDALVFNGSSNLDFQDIRSNVIRIPEVVARIREAQSIWDTVSTTPLDLANFIAAEDSVFLGHIKLKAFATAVVQVGLLDRYLKKHELPEFVVGAVNGDSPLRVALCETTFFDLVADSAVLAQPPVEKHPSGLELPVLSGVQITEYGIFRRDEGGVYLRLPTETRVMERMLADLVEDEGVRKIVTIGPGSALYGKRAMELAARDVQLFESIDLDPMLSWFWAAHAKENRLAIAN